jgi:hypothetical protein
MPHAGHSLLADYGQQYLGIGLRNCQQSACRTARLLTALLPALERTNRYTKQPGELRLRQTRSFSRFNCGGQDNPSPSRFHLFHGLKQLGSEVALGLKVPQFGSLERFSFQ